MLKLHSLTFATTTLASFLFFLLVPTAESVPPAELEKMLVINWDPTDFPASRSAEELTIEGVRALVDQYAGTEVTYLFFCQNATKTSFRSRTRETLWDLAEGVDPVLPQWAKNLKILDDRGIDCYGVWIDRCREKKISPWISMRMNDVHDFHDIKNPTLSDFWRKNRKFWRDPDVQSGNWLSRALNFAHSEVRKHALEFIRELFERYDFDGFEADWMRFGYHLTPGKEREEGRFLTDFMKEVRMIAREWEKKRNHPIYIAVRVPTVPDAAIGLGMDALQWAADGSVDLIIPSPFWSTSDFDIPVEQWRKRLDEIGNDNTAKVAFAPGFEHSMQAYPGAPRIANDLESFYGFVAACRYRGAESFYLFNWMDRSTTPVSLKDYRILLEKGVGDDVLAQAARRHPVCYHDTVPPGVSAGIQLPKQTDTKCTFQVPIGRKPASSKITLILGLAENESVKEAVLATSLNETLVEPTVDAADVKKYPGVIRALRFDCRPDAVRDGTNLITVWQESGAPQKIVWVELRIEPGN